MGHHYDWSSRFMPAIAYAPGLTVEDVRRARRLLMLRRAGAAVGARRPASAAEPESGVSILAGRCGDTPLQPADA